MDLPNLSALRLGEEPKFRRVRRVDVNPHSRRRKVRHIYEPNSAALIIHKMILHWLYLNFSREKMPYAAGGIRGTSTCRTLNRHCDSRWFWQLDIRSAFNTVTVDNCVLAMCLFREELMPPELPEMLAMYCFQPGGKGLMTGAPASNMLFNIVGAQLIDAPLVRLLHQEFGIQWRYTRYLDDLMVSSAQHNLKRMKHLRQRLRKQLEDNGWSIADHKCSLEDIRQGAIQSLGLSLVRPPGSDHAYSTLPDRVKTRIIGQLHDAAKPGSRISRAQVAGLWGVFVSSRLPQQPLTASERRIVEAYRKYQATNPKAPRSSK